MRIVYYWFLTKNNLQNDLDKYLCCYILICVQFLLYVRCPFLGSCIQKIFPCIDMFYAIHSCNNVLPYTLKVICKIKCSALFFVESVAILWIMQFFSKNRPVIKLATDHNHVVWRPRIFSPRTAPINKNNVLEPIN